jgi:hypothetical protein
MKLACFVVSLCPLVITWEPLNSFYKILYYRVLPKFLGILQFQLKFCNNRHFIWGHTAVLYLKVTLRPCGRILSQTGTRHPPPIQPCAWHHHPDILPLWTPLVPDISDITCAILRGRNSCSDGTVSHNYLQYLQESIMNWGNNWADTPELLHYAYVS